MALSHSRKINVKGLDFEWKFAHGKCRYHKESPVTGDIVVQALTQRGRMIAHLTANQLPDQYELEQGMFRASVTPVDVRTVIEAAMAQGWNVMAKEQYRLTGPLPLTDYSVPA